MIITINGDFKNKEHYICYLETKLDKIKQENERLKEENTALKLLVDWMVECDFGLDNIMDGSIDENQFEEETKNMGYTESLIHYAKTYLKQNN